MLGGIRDRLLDQAQGFLSEERSNQRIDALAVEGHLHAPLSLEAIAPFFQAIRKIELHLRAASWPEVFHVSPELALVGHDVGLRFGEHGMGTLRMLGQDLVHGLQLQDDSGEGLQQTVVEVASHAHSLFRDGGLLFRFHARRAFELPGDQKPQHVADQKQLLGVMLRIEEVDAAVDGFTVHGQREHGFHLAGAAQLGIDQRRSAIESAAVRADGCTARSLIETVILHGRIDERFVAAGLFLDAVERISGQPSDDAPRLLGFFPDHHRVPATVQRAARLQGVADDVTRLRPELARPVAQNRADLFGGTHCGVPGAPRTGAMLAPEERKYE